MDGRHVLRLDARTLPLRLGVCIAVLVLVHVVAMTLYAEGTLSRWFGEGVRRWHVGIFDLDTEAGFGTWFSAVLLLLVGRLLLHRARSLRGAGDGWATWWFVLGIGFHLLSLDEVVGLHEYLNTALGQTPWTDVGAPLVGLVALAYVPWFWRQPPHFQVATLLGAALYLGGAVGIEHATDWYADHGLLGTTEYSLWVGLEEAMEMAGPVVFLHGLLVLMAGEGRDGVVLETQVRDPVASGG
jgi:hypothetical protein